MPKMKVIKAKYPGSVWKEAVSLVLDKGRRIMDEGDKELLEVLNVVLEVENPNHVDRITKIYGDEKMIDWMRGNFLEEDPILNWGYSYGQRINNFSGINQFDRVTKRLKKDINSKAATINFLYPPGDKTHVPCVIALDIKVRDNRLIGTTFVRSQDALNKLYADILSLGAVMSKVASRLNVEVGKLCMHTVSLHIYQKDIDSLKKKGKPFLGRQMK